jgi:hypothetical protein
MKTALEILNQVEPNGELLDTDQALEAMELYAVEYAKSLKEDKWISVQEKLQGMCSSCKINEVITDGYCNCCGAKQLSYSPPKTEK